jgi:hypothetical protein
VTVIGRVAPGRRAHADPAPNISSPSITAADDPRLIQFGLKVLF